MSEKIVVLIGSEVVNEAIERPIFVALSNTDILYTYACILSQKGSSAYFVVKYEHLELLITSKHQKRKKERKHPR